MPRLLVAVLLAAVLAACGGDGGSRPGGSDPPAPGAAGREGEGEREGEREDEDPAVRRARCRTAAQNCAAVTGRVLYVEAIDPDGDGDAHYVLGAGDVTAPGLSVVDVRRHLRPRRLPRAGELVSAAGPVYTGSYGQRQIEAVEVHHQRRR